MIDRMRRVLVPTAVFALLLFTGFLFLSGASVMEDLVKTLVVSALFALYQLWSLRRRASDPTAGE